MKMEIAELSKLRTKTTIYKRKRCIRNIKCKNRIHMSEDRKKKKTHLLTKLEKS